MKNYILAIESSCDETSVAIISLQGELKANIVSSQIAVHTKFGGVMPEIASRLHIEKINYIIKEAMFVAGINFDEICGIGVTSGPGLIGALHVGLQAAKTLALMLNVPIIPVHHLVGHIYASSYVKPLIYPSLALVVSGGHTELVYMQKEFNFKIIGETQDDAVGEAYDKVARILGLPYPGGPVIDRLSKEGKVSYKLPKPHTDNPYNLSYSGLKTHINNLVNQAKMKNEEININDMCTSFQDRAINMLIEKVKFALDNFDIKQVVMAGGVSANSYLRSQMTDLINNYYKDVDLILPPLWSCTDNAAMIAKASLSLYQRNRFGELDLGAKASWSIEDFSINE